MKKISLLVPLVALLCLTKINAQNSNLKNDTQISKTNKNINITSKESEFQHSNKDWNQITRVCKKVGNITYYFPIEVSIERRNTAIKECQNSITENLEIIQEKEFSNEMDVEFINSREEMLKYTGIGAQGMAFPDRDTFFTLLKDEGSPIKHEMMHMITMYKWGTPTQTSTWMNEGLATYSGGTCSEYSLSEVYKYFIQSKKIISMDQLATNFYGNPEMIAYTQSAFVCKFLIAQYGLEKFKLLWKEGYDEMQTIYGFTNKQLETNLVEYVNKKHPIHIEFDWEEFNKGC